MYKKRNETHLALTYFSWANDLDPKGASGARRHIKEVIDPTSSLSLVPVSGPSQDQPLQASISNDQGNCNLMPIIYLKCTTLIGVYR